MFLKALFGYNGNPSLIEVISYLGYFFVIYLATQVSKQREMASVSPVYKNVVERYLPSLPV